MFFSLYIGPALGLRCQPSPTVCCFFVGIKAAVLSCDSTEIPQMNHHTWGKKGTNSNAIIETWLTQQCSFYVSNFDVRVRRDGIRDSKKRSSYTDWKFAFSAGGVTCVGLRFHGLKGAFTKLVLSRMYAFRNCQCRASGRSHLAETLHYSESDGSRV